MGEKLKVVVLDGGTGTSLINMGHKEIQSDPLWSALYISTQPQTIIDLHALFYRSGADVAVSATYQASIEGYVSRLGVTSSEAADLVTEGVILAKKARDLVFKETGRQCWVAASVGPYGATLHDFSEYHGKYADKMSTQELMTWHTPRLAALVKGCPDLLAVETIPVVKEAQAVLEGLKQFPASRAWLTFQCKDEAYTGHGERLCDAIRTSVQYDNVIGVGVNCTRVQHITPLLQSLAHLDLKVPVIVKPDGDIHGQPLGVTSLAAHAREWIDHGATWLGGCCCYGPSDIAELRHFLQSQPDIQLPGLQMRSDHCE